MRISPNLLILLTFAVLGSCAAPDPMSRPPRPDMNEVARMLDCPIGRSAACVERQNGPIRCFCMDEDALREMLEPKDY